MKKTLKIVKLNLIIILIYLLYFIFSFAIISKTNKVKETELKYDENEILGASEQTLYASLIKNSKEALDIRLKLIEQANKKIMLSYYYFRDDKSSKVLTGALLKKADEGIEITVVVDGKLPTKGKNFKTLKAHKNIEYYLYEPLSIILPHRNNNIMHDKILTIDNKYGLIGGRNLTNRFLLHDNEIITEDRDVLFYSEENENKPVLDMQKYIEEIANSNLAKQVKKGKSLSYEKSKKEIIETYENYNINSFNFTYFTNNKIQIDNASFIRSPLNRMNKEPVVAQTVFDLYEEDRKMIIQSPYIIQSKLMYKYFKFNETNKNITLLTNNITINPNFFAITGYQSIRKDLAKNFNLYEHQGSNNVHSKIILIGDEISVVGSLNMDPRSFFLSTESVLIIVSQQFNETLTLDIEDYLNNSLLVKEDGSYLEDNNVEAYPVNKFKTLTVKLFSFISNIYNHLLTNNI